jgi:hypothetical protein
MRYRKRRDDNHAELRDKLRDIPGVEVKDTASIGGGYPDLEVTYREVTYFLEVKDGKKSPSRCRLTEAERKRHAELRKAGIKVHVVKSFEEACTVIGVVGVNVRSR